MKTVEGTTYYMVPKKLPIINKDGAVKEVYSSLTADDFYYFIESKGIDWPLDITSEKTVSVQIEGKNKAAGQTKPIDVKIKNY